jgi:PIN domain nuclease of toxin-antitoxin system
MKGLLGTPAFIWWDSQPQKLSPAALAFLRDANNSIMISVVSVWEILIKQQLGKLQSRDVLTQQMANGIEVLPVTLDHVLAVEALPPVH